MIVGERPPLVFVVREGVSTVEQARANRMFPGFTPRVVYQPDDVRTGCAALTFGFDFLFSNYPNVTHGVFVADDFVYNPAWLVELESLIQRHPGARSWYVYRSNNERWHRTLREEDSDHLVTSISGPGCFAREEWRSWGVDYHIFPFPGGWTLDLLHSMMRLGERWVTARSYIQQIGVRGMHNSAQECDEAVDFVGESTEVMQLEGA